MYFDQIDDIDFKNNPFRLQLDFFAHGSFCLRLNWQERIQKPNCSGVQGCNIKLLPTIPLKGILVFDSFITSGSLNTKDGTYYRFNVSNTGL
jgi:hypothetical protein